MGKEIKPLQILFDGDIMNVIERLRDETGVKSRADVVRDAIELYNKLEEMSKGQSLILKVEGSNKEKMLVLPRKMSLKE